MLGLLILVDQSKRADTKSREKLTQFYLKNLDAVNNWDLVDASAPELLGRSLVSSKKQEVLMKLARSGQLWKERVAIVATYAFIRANAFDPTLSLAQHFLLHTHDLMHKAVGWMLREVGKRDAKALRSFLDRHAHHMPRTMLRYSIEKFGERERMAYMKKKSAKTR